MSYQVSYKITHTLRHRVTYISGSVWSCSCGFCFSTFREPQPECPFSYQVVKGWVTA